MTKKLTAPQRALLTQLAATPNGVVINDRYDPAKTLTSLGFAKQSPVRFASSNYTITSEGRAHLEDGSVR